MVCPLPPPWIGTGSEVPYAPLVNPPPPLPPRGGGRHFDISSGIGWLYCALLFFLCKCLLSELISPAIGTQIYATGTRIWYHLAARVARCWQLSYWGQGCGPYIQCLWKGHTRKSNIVFQCDSHYRGCACTAAVLKCYGLVVQSIPPPGGGGGGLSRRWGGDYKGGVRYGLGYSSD